MEGTLSLLQCLMCHTLNTHKDMCLQRRFLLAYFQSHAWVQRHNAIGACLPHCTENLILEIGIKGLGEVDSLERKRRKIQLSIYISISLLFLLWPTVFAKKCTIIPSTLHGLLQGDFDTFIWSGFLSPPPECSGPVKKIEQRKTTI